MRERRKRRRRSRRRWRMRKWEGRGDGMRQEEGGEWREDEVRGIRNIGRSGGRGGTGRQTLRLRD